MNDKQEAKFQELTGRPVGHLVCKMAVPTIISMMVTACYNMVDTYFVGQLHSNSATGAVGVVFSLMAVIQAVGFFFGHGSGNYISRQLGRHETADAEKMAATGVTLAFLAGCVILVLGQIFLTPLARLLGSTDTILPYARSYLRIILLGAPYMTASFVLNNQLRFQGSAAYGMVGIAAGAVLNVGLDLLFIMVFRWGVAGAAIATVAAQLISTVACFIYAFAKYPQLRLHREDMQITRGDIRRHVVQGVPLGLQFSVLAIGIIVMQGVVVQFDMLDGVMVSSSAQMGFGAANKLFNLTATPMNALGTAMTSFTAQNLGAGNHDRIRKGALQSLVMVSLLAAMAVGIGLLLTLGNAYLRIFLSADKITMDTVRYGNTFLYVDYAMYLFLGFIFVVRNCIQGIGLSRFVLGAGAAELVARIAVCLTLPAAVAGGVVSAQANPLAFYALCAADPMAWIAADIVLAIPFFRNILRRDYRYMNI